MPAPSCPSRETLLQYSIGMLSNEQSDDLAGHLESCPDCQATITTLEDAEDTLIGRLRTPPGSESCLAEPQFQTALAEVIAGQEKGPLESRLPLRRLSPFPSANTKSWKSWAAAAWAGSTRHCTQSSIGWLP